ncbi:MAG TPA: hypothetical protein VGN44_18610 [Candidatus Angelobacter sp.]|jgi:hypothetical protein
MKSLLVCIFCGIVMLTVQSPLMGLYVPALQNDNQETLILFAQQADDPVHIVQASLGADNTLLDALLENKKHQKIKSYRFGWIAVKKDDARISKGELVTVPESVDTASTFTVTGEGASTKADLAKHPKALVLYVAELQFQDGTQWQVDPKKIRKEAMDMAR